MASLHPKTNHIEALPRLLYLGSLPVESSSAGPLQLYRLLRNYPAERLRIVEADNGPARVERRIANVVYSELKPLFRRGWFFMRHRIPKLYWSALHWHAAWQANRMARTIAPFRPEAILTIHDGFGWVTAHKLAQRLKVPLHLILHDDWFRTLTMAPEVRARVEEYFGTVYRGAATCFCISPYMEKSYAAKFGRLGVLLYPVRNPALTDSWRSDEPVAKRPLTVAYAGNVFSSGSWLALRLISEALQPFGGELILFGPMDKNECTRNGLTGANVVPAGFLKDVELVGALRERADILFLPMTFEPEERTNMELCFPSKLADYTAAGLPIIFYGPPYCSAVHWAQENPGTGEVVTVEDRDRLAESLARLTDPTYRAKLGAHARACGDACFSAANGYAIFTSALALRT